MLQQNSSLEPVTYPEQEKQSIQELERTLKDEDSPAKLVVANGEQITIPESVYQVLRKVVHAMASGHAITVVTQQPEMTTQQAANYLNVSRPYLIKLLEQGEIPYITVGSHRRVIFEDLKKYKQQRDTERQQGLQEMTQFLQDEGFYD
ncbi:helix-turn-helix domain-containing protein [Calothrix sp. PCC 7507]|uniref:helix-turn-helix domain-containing protein n=1 Tax=Calothrix sp. PCC 7507 TaxID=99598 RepID=UPI00029F178A|nr:helix-turn-helix domain-containing protein [Calothrix sp. PCC 7507]AFY35928.1 DNA binding domain protein, excisionase family [Calothrix sp. PCC 7507]